MTLPSCIKVLPNKPFDVISELFGIYELEMIAGFG